MIRVDILKNQSGDIAAFRVEGHAGYEEAGKDIVCAGVSAITQTVLKGLLAYLDRKPVYRVEQGILACSLPDDMSDEDAARARLLLNTMELGLKDLEFVYSDFIKIEIRRC